MDDLLGAWGSAPAKKEQARAPSAIMASPAEEDLLGGWAVPETPVTVPARTAQPAIAVPADESLSRAVNRWAAQNKGDSVGEKAARVGLGALRGIDDVAATLALGIGAAGDKGANVLSRMGVISPESAGAVKDWRGRIGAEVAADNAGFTEAAGDSELASAGRIGGQILGTAPFMGVAGRAAMLPVNAITRASPGLAQLVAQPGKIMNAAKIIGGGAATGAGATLLTSGASEEPVADQVMSGAGVGAVLGPVGAGAAKLGGKLFGGRMDSETAKLARQARDEFGIPIDPGQMSANPTVRFLDSVLQRLPFTGYGDRAANQQGAFNRAIGQTFGQDVEKITPDVIRTAKKDIGHVFEDVANRTGQIRTDLPFVNSLRTILSDSRAVLGDLPQIERQVQNIVKVVDPRTNTISAESYQALTRKGTPLDRLMKSVDPNVRHYATEIREALDDVMQRSAPADAVADLIRARAQWKALKTVEPLAKKAATGDISPRSLLSSVNKSYSGDGAQLGKLGRVGQRFMTEPPSSGTAERSLIMQHLIPGAAGLAGVGGLGAATYFDPESYQRNLALAAAGYGLARGGSAALRSNALSNIMINRGAGAAPAAVSGPRSNPLLTIIPAAGALAAQRPPPRLPAP